MHVFNYCVYFAIVIFIFDRDWGRGMLFKVFFCLFVCFNVSHSHFGLCSDPAQQNLTGTPSG